MGDCQALALKLGEVGGAVCGLARQQDIGVLQVRPAEIEQGVPLLAREQCCDDISLVVFDALDHFIVVAAALDVEAQPCAQPDQLKQVRGNPTEVTCAVEKRQRRERLVDDHANYRMLRQPALLAVTELQFVIGKQNVAAGTPAFGDVFSNAGGDGQEHRIDDPEQLRVVFMHRKTEAVGFVFAEVGHADIVQVPLVDHVVSGNGVAEKHVGLVEGNGIDRILVGRIRGNDRLWIQCLDLIQRQVVIHHAQAHTGEAIGQGAGFAFTRYQYRLIHGVGLGQYDVGATRFESVGSTEQIHFAVFEGLNGRAPGRKALDRDGQAGRLAEDTGVVGGESFIIVAAEGQVEGRIIRR
ncbi:hypothetical protein D3C86_527670 [compost metagenome]